MKIIAIDPGVTTGFCHAFYRQEHKLVQYYPFQLVEDVDEFWHHLARIQPRYIIMEDFVHRHNQTKVNYFPIQLIGVARLYSLVANHQCAIIMQTPAKGKSYYSDTILRNNGLYKRGVPHGMDASRHLLQWLTFGAGYELVEGVKDFAMLLEKDPFKDSELHS